MRTRPSLAATLAIGFLAIGLPMLSISNVLLLVSSTRAQRRAISGDQQKIAKETANSVSAYVQDKFQLMETAIWLDNPYAASPAERKLMLDGLLGLQPAFKELALLDSGGRPLAQASRHLATRRLAQRLGAEAWAELLKGGKRISPVYIDPVSSEPTVTISVPVFDSLRDARGSLVAELNLMFMWDLVSGLKVRETGYAYVVDRQGALIAFNDTARVLKGENAGAYRPVGDFMRDPSAQPPGAASTYRGINGTKVVGSYVPLGTPDWAVVTELPWTEANREVIRQMVLSLMITLAMATLLGVMGVILARRLAVPLVKLMETATSIAGGKRELQAAVGGPREVAGLAMAFNSMTGQLRQSLESLERQVTEIRRAEERFRSLVETTSDWVWEADRNGAFTYASPRVGEVLGFSPEEILRKTVYDLLPAGESESLRAEFQKIIDSEKPFQRLENESLRKDGSVAIMESSGVPVFGEDGALVGYRGIDRDITEMKKAQQEQAKLQEQLQQAIKMEAIGQLAGGIAHDFNNLLTVIIGNTDLARMSLAPEDSAMRFFDQIETAAQSAASLTRQLLAFARRQLIQPKVMNLNELVAKFKDAFTRLLGEDIRLENILDPGLWNALVDPGQMEQVLVNLATNARAAMPSGGRLIIETSNAYLDESYCARHAQTRPGEYVLLAVSDSGCGMSAETQTHLFEPFFTTKPVGQGTGLGLATVFGIIKQAGGSIEVYSEEGRGTQFKIFLPRVAEGAPAGPEAEAPRELPTGNETILVVEDNDSVRLSVVKTLESLRYKVLSTPDPADVIEFAESYRDRIDLLLTDVVMPGLAGPELAKRLLACHPEMKVLCTSGYTHNVVAYHGIIDDKLNFIAKPYTIRQIAAKVREALGSE
jgi:PAS domain S-box-containing protein